MDICFRLSRCLLLFDLTPWSGLGGTTGWAYSFPVVSLLGRKSLVLLPPAEPLRPEPPNFPTQGLLTTLSLGTA